MLNTSRYLLLILSALLPLHFQTEISLHTSDIQSACATEVTDRLPFEGSILLRSHQGADSVFSFVDSTGQLVIFGPAPSEIRSYYDALSSNLLLLYRDVYGSESNREESNFYRIKVWLLNSQSPAVTATTVPAVFRSLQWLSPNMFLFADIWKDSFAILSIDANEVHLTDRPYDLPEMRSIPLHYQADFDIAFSRDGRFAAYENEVIRRGLVIWNIETSRQIAQFVTDYSGLEESHPVWSYDSTKLAFALFVKTEMQLHLFDVNLGQLTQITEFQTDLPEYGRPWSTIHLGSWSPTDRYLPFSGILNNSSLRILDTETMAIVDTCLQYAPLFWLPSGNLLVLYGDPIRVLDVENNRVYRLSDELGEPIGASMQPLSHFITQA